MTSITIDDVAALAGVSIKTVSRVLNREPYVREDTRDRVLKAVKALNYTPNFAARALAGSRAYLIGLYYEYPTPYVSGLQMGAMSRCREDGYHLLVEQIDGDAAGAQTDNLLSTVKVDGVILSPPVCDDQAVLEVLDRRGVPYVRIAPAGEFARGPYVFMDDRQAAYAMTQHLLSLGHTRIGFIKGHAGHSASTLRYEGFQQAMQDARLTVAPELIQSGNFSFRAGVGAAERLLNLSHRPTAIFASNDDMALGVMAVAGRMHLAMPHQLSIAGFDDSVIAEAVWPQLTTVRQPIARMASEAAAMLIDWQKRPDKAQGRLLDFELIVRGSTGFHRPA